MCLLPLSSAANHADIKNTGYCKSYQFQEPVHEIYRAAHDYDNTSNGEIQSLPIGLGAFQMPQSKAFEMLGVPLSKALPRKFISNASPLTVALTKCDNAKNVLSRTTDCNPENAAVLFERVSYLICCDGNPKKDRCIQVYRPDASESIDIYRKAMSNATPWVYVYGPLEFITSESPLPMDRELCLIH